ncbi:MAG: hypothetical protein J5982_02040 [Bacilli bacterium]|nr:hypothetical protein [Bacilli bacterium]
MKKYISIVLSIMSLFIFPYNVDADTATISYDGKSNYLTPYKLLTIYLVLL